MVIKTMVEMTKYYFKCNCLIVSSLSLHLSGVPSSSSPVERLFSKTGKIFTPENFPVLLNSLSTGEDEEGTPRTLACKLHNR